jgi:hypothetical protein
MTRIEMKSMVMISRSVRFGSVGWVRLPSAALGLSPNKRLGGIADRFRPVSRAYF